MATVRRLTKEAKPAVLTEREAEWTASYLDWRARRAAGTAARESEPRRWGHAEIRESLETETNRKCCYCDSLIGAVAHEHIEHIKPRAHRPELVVNWENLTLACPKCNGYKGDYFSDTEPLLNPYTDDPQEHLSFLGATVTYRPGSEIGQRTVLKLRLYRTDLMLARSRRVEQVAQLVHQWAQADGLLAETLAEIINEEASADAEHAATIQAYLRHIGFPLSDPSC